MVFRPTLPKIKPEVTALASHGVAGKGYGAEVAQLSLGHVSSRVPAPSPVLKLSASVSAALNAGHPVAAPLPRSKPTRPELSTLPPPAVMAELAPAPVRLSAVLAPAPHTEVSLPTHTSAHLASSAPTPLSSPLPAPAPRPDLYAYFGPESQGGLRLPETAPTPLFKEIRVKAGDTLYGLAKQHDVPAAALAASSGLTDVHSLKVGQTLRVPTAAGLALPQLVEVSAVYSQALSDYDRSYAQHQKAQAQRQQEIKQQQYEARDWARQQGLAAGQLPPMWNALVSPADAAAASSSSSSSSAPIPNSKIAHKGGKSGQAHGLIQFQAVVPKPSKGQPAPILDSRPNDITQHLGVVANPEHSIVFTAPGYVAATDRSRTRDRFDASIHNYIASNSGALEVLSGAYQSRRLKAEQDTSFMGRVGHFLERGAAALSMGQPVLSILTEVARRPEWEQYFRTKRIEHEDKAQVLQQQVELKGGVNEWSQVNVRARGLDDLVNYGEGLVLGTLPTLVAATTGALALRGTLGATAWAVRSGLFAGEVSGTTLTGAAAAKLGQMAGTFGVLGATTLSSHGSLLDAQRDQTGGLIHLGSAAALTPLFVAANAFGITGSIARNTVVQSTIKGLDAIPGVTGAVTRTAANTLKLGVVEGGMEFYQEGVVSQLARMKVDAHETFFNERANHRRYEAFAGGAFMGGTFGAAKGRRSSGYQGASQSTFMNELTAAAQGAQTLDAQTLDAQTLPVQEKNHLQLVVNHAEASPSVGFAWNNPKVRKGNSTDPMVSGWAQPKPEWGADGLGRTRASTPSTQPFQPLQPARPDLAHAWHFELQVEPQREGGYRVAPGPNLNNQPQNQPQADVLSVDRDGTLDIHLPHPAHAKAEATQKELLLSAAHTLNEHAIQVNTMRQRLQLDSADSSAALFVERTHHYHHEQSLPLLEAAHAAAADVLKQAPLTGDFGFTQARAVRISGNEVLIEAQRESAVTFEPATDADLSALKAQVAQFAQTKSQALARAIAHEPLTLIQTQTYDSHATPLKQPDRSAGMPEETSVQWLLDQEHTLIPGKQGVWITEDWTDEQLLRLAEKLNAQVALTRIDGRLRLTSGTSNHVFAEPDFFYETGAPLRVVHLQPPRSSKYEQILASALLTKTRQTRPNARAPQSEVIYRGVDGQVELQPYGPRPGSNKVRRYSAQSLGLEGRALEGAPDLSIATRKVYEGRTFDEMTPHLVVVRIAGLGGTPDIAQIRNAVHRMAQQQRAKLIRFEWDLEGASDSTRKNVASNMGLAVEPRYHFDFRSYTEGQLLTWNESIDAPGQPYIEGKGKGNSFPEPRQRMPANPQIAADIKASFYDAMSTVGLKGFEVLANLLKFPFLQLSHLARRHGLNGDIEKVLGDLFSGLNKTAPRYLDLPMQIAQFLKPLLSGVHTPQTYLENLIANPGQWLKSRDLIRTTRPTRLTLLSQHELVGLKMFAENGYQIKSFMGQLNGPTGAQDHFSSITQELLYLFDPKASNWQSLDSSYAGGLAQLAQDVDTELALREKGEARAVNYPALWMDSKIDGKERASFKQGTRWHLDIGEPNSVTAELDAAQIRALSHTHPQGDTDAQAQQAHSEDIAGLAKINAIRRSAQQPARLSSARYGPSNHHVVYFGLPADKMPLNARLMNALGDARRTITAAVAATSLERLPTFPALWLKRLDVNTAVIRMGSIDPIDLPRAFEAMRTWVDQNPHLRTLRIESYIHDGDTLQKHLRDDASRTHITQEESYDLQSGEFDLKHTMSVAAIAVRNTRANADAHAHQLQDVERAYALRTLYFAGNKTYDRPDVPGAVNLEKFLPKGANPISIDASVEKPLVGSTPSSHVQVTFRSNQESAQKTTPVSFSATSDEAWTVSRVLQAPNNQTHLPALHDFVERVAALIQTGAGPWGAVQRVLNKFSLRQIGELQHIAQQLNTHVHSLPYVLSRTFEGNPSTRLAAAASFIRYQAGKKTWFKEAAAAAQPKASAEMGVADEKILAALAAADPFDHFVLALYLKGLSLQQIVNQLKSEGADLSINVVRDRLNQISFQMFGTSELEQLRSNLRTLGAEAIEMMDALVKNPRDWAQQYLSRRLSEKNLEALKVSELRVLQKFLEQRQRGLARDADAVSQVLQVHPATVYKNEASTYKKIDVQNLNELVLRYDGTAEALSQAVRTTLEEQLKGRAVHKPVLAPKDQLVARLMALSDAHLQFLSDYLQGRSPYQIAYAKRLDNSIVVNVIERFENYVRGLVAADSQSLHVDQQIKVLYPELQSASAALVKQLIDNPKSWAAAHYRGAALDLEALKQFGARDIQLLLAFINPTSTKALAQHWNLTQDSIYREKSRLLKALHALSVPDLVRRAGGKKQLLWLIAATPHTQQLKPSRVVRHADTWKQAQRLGVETATSKQARDWVESIGIEQGVPVAPDDLSQVHHLRHVHADAATRPQKRAVSGADARAAQKVNEQRLKEGRGPLLQSIAIGPNHSIYFGMPEEQMPLNARVINELEYTRREISATVRRSRFARVEDLNLKLPPGAQLKRIKGVAVLRVQHMDAETLTHVIAWARTQEGLHTLRVEAPDRNSLERVKQEQARHTVEDGYDFNNGRFDLNTSLAVITVPLHRTLAQADAHINDLSSTERAYAFQSLYFDGHRAYERVGVEGAVNLKDVLRSDRPGLVVEAEERARPARKQALWFSAPTDPEDASISEPGAVPFTDNTSTGALPLQTEDGIAVHTVLTAPDNSLDLPVLLNFIERVLSAQAEGKGPWGAAQLALDHYSVSEKAINRIAQQLNVSANALPSTLKSAFENENAPGLERAVSFIRQQILVPRAPKQEITYPPRHEIHRNLYPLLWQGSESRAWVELAAELMASGPNKKKRTPPEQVAQRHNITLAALTANIAHFAQALDPQKTPPQDLPALLSYLTGLIRVVSGRLPLSEFLHTALTDPQRWAVKTRLLPALKYQQIVKRLSTEQMAWLLNYEKNRYDIEHMATSLGRPRAEVEQEVAPILAALGLKFERELRLLYPEGVTHLKNKAEQWARREIENETARQKRMTEAAAVIEKKKEKTERDRAKDKAPQAPHPQERAEAQALRRKTREEMLAAAIALKKKRREKARVAAELKREEYRRAKAEESARKQQERAAVKALEEQQRVQARAEARAEAQALRQKNREEVLAAAIALKKKRREKARVAAELKREEYRRAKAEESARKQQEKAAAKALEEQQRVQARAEAQALRRKTREEMLAAAIALKKQRREKARVAAESRREEYRRAKAEERARKQQEKAAAKALEEQQRAQERANAQALEAQTHARAEAGFWEQRDKAADSGLQKVHEAVLLDIGLLSLGKAQAMAAFIRAGSIKGGAHALEKNISNTRGHKVEALRELRSSQAELMRLFHLLPEARQEVLAALDARIQQLLAGSHFWRQLQQASAKRAGGQETATTSNVDLHDYGVDPARIRSLTAKKAEALAAFISGGNLQAAAALLGTDSNWVKRGKAEALLHLHLSHETFQNNWPPLARQKLLEELAAHLKELSDRAESIRQQDEALALKVEAALTQAYDAALLQIPALPVNQARALAHFIQTGDVARASRDLRMPHSTFTAYKSAALDLLGLTVDQFERLSLPQMQEMHKRLVAVKKPEAQVQQPSQLKPVSEPQPPKRIESAAHEMSLVRELTQIKGVDIYALSASEAMALLKVVTQALNQHRAHPLDNPYPLNASSATEGKFQSDARLKLGIDKFFAERLGEFLSATQTLPIPALQELVRWKYGENALQQSTASPLSALSEKELRDVLGDTRPEHVVENLRLDLIRHLGVFYPDHNSVFTETEVKRRRAAANETYPATPSLERAELEKLSPLEQKVLAYLLAGKTQQQISGGMKMQLRHVRVTEQRLREKLYIRHRDTAGEVWARYAEPSASNDKAQSHGQQLYEDLQALIGGDALREIFPDIVVPKPASQLPTFLGNGPHSIGRTFNFPNHEQGAEGGRYVPGENLKQNSEPSESIAPWEEKENQAARALLEAPHHAADLNGLIAFLKQVQQAKQRNAFILPFVDTLLRNYGLRRRLLEQYAAQLDINVYALPDRLSRAYASGQREDGLAAVIEFLEASIEKQQRGSEQKRAQLQEISQGLEAVLLNGGQALLHQARDLMAQNKTGNGPFDLEKIVRMHGLQSVEELQRNLHQFAVLLGSQNVPEDTAELATHLNRLVRQVVPGYKAVRNFIDELLQKGKRKAVARGEITPLGPGAVLDRLSAEQLTLLYQFEEHGYDALLVARKTEQKLAEVTDQGNAILAALNYRSWSQFQRLYPVGLGHLQKKAAARKAATIKTNEPPTLKTQEHVRTPGRNEKLAALEGTTSIGANKSGDPDAPLHLLKTKVVQAGQRPEQIQRMLEQLEALDLGHLSRLTPDKTSDKTLKNAKILLAWVTDLRNAHVMQVVANPYPLAPISTKAYEIRAAFIRRALNVDALLDAKLLRASEVQKKVRAAQINPADAATQTSTQAGSETDIPAWWSALEQLRLHLIRHIEQSLRSKNVQAQTQMQKHATRSSTPGTSPRSVVDVENTIAFAQTVSRLRLADFYELGAQDAAYGLKLVTEALSTHYGTPLDNPYPLAHLSEGPKRKASWNFRTGLGLSKRFEEELAAYLRDANAWPEQTQTLVSEDTTPLTLIENLRTNLIHHLQRIYPDPRGSAQLVEIKKLRDARYTLIAQRELMRIETERGPREITSYAPRAIEPRSPPLSKAGLTFPELQVLAHLMAGRSPDQIARIMGFETVHSVVTAESRLRAKLRLRQPDTVGELIARYPSSEQSQLYLDLEAQLGQDIFHDEVIAPLAPLRRALAAMNLPTEVLDQAKALDAQSLVTLPLYGWMQQAQTTRTQTTRTQATRTKEKADLFSEPELIAGHQKMTPEMQRFLRHWVQHPNDPQALMQAAKMMRSDMGNYRDRIKDAFKVSSFEELDRRAPGGAQALLAYLEWQRQLDAQGRSASNPEQGADGLGGTVTFGSPKNQNIAQELLLRESEHSTVERPGRIDWAKVWRESFAEDKELLVTKEGREHEQGGHATLQRTGNSIQVAAQFNPRQLYMVTHTHVRGPFDADERSFVGQDEIARQQINAHRAATLPMAVRVGPRGHHVVYGQPRTANARIINELERTRRVIAEVVATTPEKNFLDLATRAHLKLMQGTAVLRLDELQKHLWPQTVAIALAHVQRENLSTLRVEIPNAELNALRDVLPAQQQAQAHYTQEDFYDFDGGRYNLTKDMGVISLALNQTRAEADQQAPTLIGVDRAYAFQTLALSEINQPYAAVRRRLLSEFLPAAAIPAVASAPNRVAAPSDAGLELIWHAPDAAHVRAIDATRWRAGKNGQSPADFAQSLWEKYGKALGIDNVQEYVAQAHWAMSLPRSATVHRVQLLNDQVVTYLSDKNWIVISRNGVPLFFNYPVNAQTGGPGGSHQWHRMARKELPVNLKAPMHYELALVALRGIDIDARLNEGDTIQRIAEDLFRMRWKLEARRFELVNYAKAQAAKKLDREISGTRPEDRAYQRVLDLEFDARKIIEMARGADLTYLARDPDFIQKQRYDRWAPQDESMTSAQSAWATWLKYEAMFPQFHSIHQYVRTARDLAQARPSLSVRQWQLASNDWVIYDETRNLWLVTDAQRVPREMFYPGGSPESKAEGQAQWQRLMEAEGVIAVRNQGNEVSDAADADAAPAQLVRPETLRPIAPHQAHMAAPAQLKKNLYDLLLSGRTDWLTQAQSFLEQAGPGQVRYSLDDVAREHGLKNAQVASDNMQILARKLNPAAPPPTDHAPLLSYLQLLFKGMAGPDESVDAFIERVRTEPQHWAIQQGFVSVQSVPDILRRLNPGQLRALQEVNDGRYARKLTQRADPALYEALGYTSWAELRFAYPNGLGDLVGEAERRTRAAQSIRQHAQMTGLREPPQIQRTEEDAAVVSPPSTRLDEAAAGLVTRVDAGVGAAGRATPKTPKRNRPVRSQMDRATWNSFKEVLNREENAANLPVLLNFLEQIRGSHIKSWAESEKGLRHPRIRTAVIEDFARQFESNVQYLPALLANSLGGLGLVRTFLRRKIEAAQPSGLLFSQAVSELSLLKTQAFSRFSLYALNEKEAAYGLKLVTDILNRYRTSSLPDLYPLGALPSRRTQQRLRHDFYAKLGLNPRLVQQLMRQNIDLLPLEMVADLKPGGKAATALEHLRLDLIQHLHRFYPVANQPAQHAEVNRLRAAVAQPYPNQPQLKPLQSYGLTLSELKVVAHLWMGRNYEQIRARMGFENLETAIEYERHVRQKLGLTHADTVGEILARYDASELESGQQFFADLKVLVGAEVFDHEVLDPWAPLNQALEKLNADTVKAGSAMKVGEVYQHMVRSAAAKPQGLSAPEIDMLSLTLQRVRRSTSTDVPVASAPNAEVPSRSVTQRVAQRVAQRLMSLTEAEVKVLYAHVDGTLSTTEIGERVGWDKTQVRIFLNNFPKGHTPNGRRSEINQMLESVVPSRQSAADFLWQLVIDRQRWVNQQSFAPVFKEADLKAMTQDMTPVDFDFLKAWVKHGDDPDAIAAELQVNKDTVRRYKTRVNKALGTASLEEIKLRTPGGLEGVLFYLEWRKAQQRAGI